MDHVSGEDDKGLKNETGDDDPDTTERLHNQHKDTSNKITGRNPVMEAGNEHSQMLHTNEYCSKASNKIDTASNAIFWTRQTTASQQSSPQSMTHDSSHINKLPSDPTHATDERIPYTSLQLPPLYRTTTSYHVLELQYPPPTPSQPALQ